MAFITPDFAGDPTMHMFGLLVLLVVGAVILKSVWDWLTGNS